MTTKKKIFTANNRSDISHLSSDGIYLAIGNQVYKYSGSTYVFDQTLPYTTVSYVHFLGNNPSQLFIMTPTAIVLYDCDTKAQLFSLPGNVDYNSVQFDDATNTVCLTDGQQKVFDLKTRTLTSVFVNPLSVFYSGGVFFTELPQDGYRYALKDY